MKRIKDCILDWLPLAIALLLLSLMFMSCKSANHIVYVPLHDTIKDNVYTHTHDTTIIEKTREVVVHGDCVDTHDTIREVRIKIAHDTMVNYQYIEKPIEVEVVKYVKRPINAWLLCIAAVSIIVAILSFSTKNKRK